MAVVDQMPNAARSILSIELLSGPYFEINGTSLDIRSTKAKLLLAALALSPKQVLTREWLRGVLWSNVEEDKAQVSLRNLIWKLNSIFESNNYTGFDTGASHLCLKRASFTTDIDIVFAALKNQVVDDRMIRNPRLFEEFLYGYEGLEEGFDEWIRATREALQRGWITKLEEQLQSIKGNPAAQIALSKLLIEYDGMNETAYRALIRGHHTQGDTAQALAHYQTLWNRLDNIFGEEPSQPTQQLIVEIKSEDNEESTNSVPVPVELSLREELRPRIFIDQINLSAIETGRHHLFEGFRHDLSACLIRFREWQIVDRIDLNSDQLDNLLSSESYQLCFEGYTTETDLFISLTFKDIATGIFVWSERLQHGLQHWIQLQHEIAEKLAIALNIHLSADRLSRALSTSDGSLGTYDQWLRGEQHLSDRKPQSWARASALFQSVVKQQPGFARGYSSLAQIENGRHMWFPGIFSDEISRKNGLAYARQAVELDPLDSRSQLSLGWASAMLGQFSRAELAFDLAYKNNENDPWTIVSAAVGLAFCDQIDIARDLSRRALSLDLAPTKLHWNFRAVIHFIDGEYETCIEALTLSGDVLPDTLAWHAAALSYLGRKDEARSKLTGFIEATQRDWAADTIPNPDSIAKWLFSCYPFRNIETWSCLREGLADAGLPMPIPTLPTHGVNH